MDSQTSQNRWLPLIALEGPSGVGKSTLLRAIAARLADAAITAELASNNDSGRWPPIIRGLAALPDRPLSLALATAAARAELRESATRPLLCDRYVISTLVYQRFAGVPLEYLYATNLPLLSSSVTFVLKLNAAELADRRRHSPEKSDWFKEHLDMEQELKLYDDASELLSKKGHDVRIVDASMDEGSLADCLFVDIDAMWARFRQS